MSPLQLDSPVRFLKGVGPRRSDALATLGVQTVADLLFYFPFRYELETGAVDIENLELGQIATIRGEVVSVRRGRTGSISARIHDGTADCTLRWFNQAFRSTQVRTGLAVEATGKITEFEGEPEILHPTVRVLHDDDAPVAPRDGARLVGVYRGNAQCKSIIVRRAVESLFSLGAPPIQDVVPDHILKRVGLPIRAAAVRSLHQPRSEPDAALARRRLAFEEFLLLELAVLLRRNHHKLLETARKLHVTLEIDQRIRARFPFAFTAAQDRAVRELAADLTSGRPMTRLLQGDVGSGKTVVALYACLVAVANRRQAAIMGPTEILAQQHFASIEKYLAGKAVRRALVSAATTARGRGELLSRIERGEIDLVVGTQALLEKDVAFRDLALVVVDEQHKFGVLQRAAIRTKGPRPHYLVMTATPIPRTLAMTVFGDLDVTTLDALPPGRQPIKTRVVAARQWETVMGYVRKRLESGEQAYVVCPMIGENVGQPPSAALRRPLEASPQEQAPRQTQDTAEARTVHARLRDGPWRSLRIGLLHGSLPSAEKQSVMDEFAAGRLQALVATTVVEVGVDVPNATIMIVEHAERFGLSQLHQLRGRVGRGSKASLCVLINRAGDRASRTSRASAAEVAPRESASKAAERLKVLAGTTDGFAIAEADLRLRGPGELFGPRQHGLPELRFGNLVEDFDLLETARREATALLANDPQLSAPDHNALADALRHSFGAKLAMLDAG